MRKCVHSSLLLLLLFVSCSKKPEPPQEQAPSSTTVKTAEPSVPNAANVPNVLHLRDDAVDAEIAAISLPQMHFDKAMAAVPAPVNMSELYKMPPAQMEMAIADSFSHYVPPDGPDVLRLRKYADEGYDSAREKLGLYYLSMPFADKRYEEGRRYLSETEHFSTASGWFMRGRFEYHGDRNNLGRAVAYFEKAAEAPDCTAEMLQYFMDHDEIPLPDRTSAASKLVDLYTKQVKAGDKSARKNLLRAYGTNGFARDDEKYASVLMDGANAKDPDIIVFLSGMVQDKEPEKSFSVLQRAALSGSRDALEWMAEYYGMTILLPKENEISKDNPGMVLSPLGTAVPVTYYNYIKSVVSGTSDKDMAQLFSRFANHAPSPKVCFYTLKAALAKDTSPEYKSLIDDAISCGARMIKQELGYDKCREIESIYTLSDSERAKLTPDQAARLAELFPACAQSVLSEGIIYDADNPVIASPFSLYAQYSGDVVRDLPVNMTRAVQYLILGAQTGDMMSQAVLALEYLGENTTGIPASQARASYWAAQARSNPVCDGTCRKLTHSPDGDMAVLVDLDISPDRLEEIYTVCKLCESVRNIE